MNNRYRITVTDEQLLGLEHALACAQVKYAREIPEYEKDVERCEKKPDDYPEKAQRLATMRKDLEDARESSAMVKAAVPALRDAKLIPAEFPLASQVHS